MSLVPWLYDSSCFKTFFIVNFTYNTAVMEIWNYRLWTSEQYTGKCPQHTECTTGTALLRGNLVLHIHTANSDHKESNKRMHFKYVNKYLGGYFPLKPNKQKSDSHKISFIFIRCHADRAPLNNFFHSSEVETWTLLRTLQQ